MSCIETVRVMSTPKKIDIALTNNCNLRCRYCYFFTSEADTGRDLATADWLKFFGELKDCVVMDVCLAGGEPFMRPDLRELIAGVVDSRLRYTLLSNGTLIDDSIAGFIAATKRCNSVQVSIDGADSSVHNASRGGFADAVRGIHILQRHNIPVTVRLTINRFNVNKLEETAAFLFDEIGLPSFSTNSAAYMGLCRQNNDEISLTTADRMTAMRSLLRIIKKYGNRIGAQAGPLAEARMWREMERQINNHEQPGSRCGVLGGCGGMFSTLAVRADGVITPCTQMPQVELGRINQDSIRKIWQTNPELQRLRERAETKLSSFAMCRDCEYAAYCTGNCPAVAYNLSGAVNVPAPDACYKRFLADGGKLPDESEYDE
ncbi:MAG: SynChlorMet cassette radical SAM/SPASM protein ScmE [Bacillota bacterium]